MPSSANDWHGANQCYLTAALAVVREALKRHASRVPGEQSDAQTPQTDTHASPADATGKSQDGQANLELEKIVATLPAPSALDTLCEAFALSPFERDVLLLCAGMELDSHFAAHCAAAQGDPQRPYPTFSLALAALPDAHWSALTPGAPLRRWRMIEVGTGNALTISPLRIDERVLHYLTGVSYLDERLQGFVEPLHAPGALPPSHQTLADRISELCSREPGTSPIPVIQLCGNDHAGKCAIAVSACAALRLHLNVIRAANIPVAAVERETLTCLWMREAVLSGSALLVDCDEIDGTANMQAVVSLLEHAQGVLMTTSREPVHMRMRPAVRLDVNRPSTGEQWALWRTALGSAAEKSNGEVQAVVQQFQLGVQGIHAASRQAMAAFSKGQEEGLSSSLWEACRAQARPRLNDLAQRIELAATWDELVLPELQRQALCDIATHVRQRTKVYESWGFAAKGRRGLGISALFAGASGTGKTMAAEVLANELRLDLYRIDLSQVVSKYIGETEKNLRRVFDAAEEGGAILLFDEADALFGKRSEVKDSHDRYANIEISYLLQRMEAYRGLAILTTNMKEALDKAFLRRIRFVVQFPFPDAAQRAEIWRRIFPPDTPTDGLDPNRLCRLNVAGGNIRNIALNAAFLAVDAGEPVRLPHVLRAARSEYAKLEKPLTESEVGSWI